MRIKKGVIEFIASIISEHSSITSLEQDKRLFITEILFYFIIINTYLKSQKKKYNNKEKNLLYYYKIKLNKIFNFLRNSYYVF